MEEKSVELTPVPLSSETISTPTKHVSSLVKFLPLFAILSVILIVGSAYAFSKSRPVPQQAVLSEVTPTVTPGFAPTSTVAFNLKTYSNDIYSFKYPESFKQEIVQQPYFYLPTRSDSLTANTSLLNLPNYSQDSTFAVSFSRSVVNCLTSPDQNAQSKGTKVINGTTFTLFSIESAGAGNRYMTDIYRATNNGMCFELAQTIHTSTDGNGVDQIEMQKSIDAAKIELDSITNSFVFLKKTSADAKTWELYTNKPFSFQYPSYLGELKLREKNFAEAAQPDTYEGIYQDLSISGGGAYYTVWLQITGPYTDVKDTAVSDWIKKTDRGTLGDYGEKVPTVQKEVDVAGTKAVLLTVTTDGETFPTQSVLYFNTRDGIYSMNHRIIVGDPKLKSYADDFTTMIQSIQFSPEKVEPAGL